MNSKKNIQKQEFEVKVVEELTLLLLWLTAWEEEGLEGGIFRSWRNHDFDALDGLREKNLIFGSKRAKSVYFTEEGESRVKKLEKKYLDSLVDRGGKENAEK